MPLHEALFVESNPGPIKYAVSKLGLCGDETRLPLAPISDDSRSIVDAALEKAGIQPASLTTPSDFPAKAGTQTTLR